MSFWLGEIYKLQAHAGQACWAEYQRLVAECDASAFDSECHRALAKWQQAWVQNSQAVIAAAEAKAAQEGKDV
jgi:hypothetical protein